MALDAASPPGLDLPALATFLGTLPTNLVYASIGAGLERMFAEGREPNLHLLLDSRVFTPLPPWINLQSRPASLKKPIRSATNCV